MGIALACATATSILFAPAAYSKHKPTPTPTPQPTPVPLIAPLSLSLQPVPAYGVAPLTVGFFVKAVDPENAGFIRYEWNFGDGHISTLPPLMAFETYQTPGTYMVTLTAVTPDGRSASAFAGVLVRSPSLQ
jgi:hypothetical protein